MSSLTLKEIVTQIWGKCKSTYAKKSIYSDTAISRGRKQDSEIGENSIAYGYNVVASGYSSHAEGINTTASGSPSHAEGSYTKASGSSSHAEGNGTKASGSSSHAEGSSTTASESYSHAEGSYTTASGSSSHAEGSSTTASESYSHAEGSYTTASGYYSHAEGNGTKASSSSSHAEGNGTKASEYSSHAEGNGTTASGSCSHAEGNGTTASGKYSHSSGLYTIAGYPSQMVIGQYNNNKEGNLFEVGNGFRDRGDNVTRSNALEVNKDGNVIIQNNLNVGGTINSTSLKNLPVWTLDDIQESDEPVNIFKYFLGNSYNDLTTCNRWFIVMPQTSRQFFIGHENKEGVILSLQLTGEMHLLYFIKTSEKWTITLYSITGKLNGSGTKPSPIISARSFVEDESGNFSALNTIPTFVTSTSGMMDTNYTPSMDRHVVTLKYLNTRIQEFLNNEVTSKITEELAKINNAEDNTY